MSWLWKSGQVPEGVQTNNVEELWSSQVQKFAAVNPSCSSGNQSNIKELFRQAAALKSTNQKIFNALFWGDYSIENIKLKFEEWKGEIKKNLSELSSKKTHLQDLVEDKNPSVVLDIRLLRFIFNQIENQGSHLITLLKSNNFLKVCNWHKKLKASCLVIIGETDYNVSVEKINYLIDKVILKISSNETGLNLPLLRNIKYFHFESCVLVEQVLWKWNSGVGAGLKLDADRLFQAKSQIEKELKDLTPPNLSNKIDLEEFSQKSAKSRAFSTRINLWFPKLQKLLGRFPDTWPVLSKLQLIGQCCVGLTSLIEDLFQKIAHTEFESLKDLEKECDKCRDILHTLQSDLRTQLDVMCTTDATPLAHDALQNSNGLLALISELRENLQLLYALTAPLSQEAYRVEKALLAHIQTEFLPLAYLSSFHHQAEQVKTLSKRISKGTTQNAFIDLNLKLDHKMAEGLLAADLLKVTLIEDEETHLVWETVMGQISFTNDATLANQIKNYIAKKLTQIMYISPSKGSDIELLLAVMRTVYLPWWKTQIADDAFKYIVDKYEKRASKERLKDEPLALLTHVCFLAHKAKKQHDCFAFGEAYQRLIEFTQISKQQEYFEFVFGKLSSVATLQGYLIAHPAKFKEFYQSHLVAKESEQDIMLFILSNTLWGKAKREYDAILGELRKSAHSQHPDLQWMLALYDFRKIIQGEKVASTVSQIESLLPIAKAVLHIASARQYAEAWQRLFDYSYEHRNQPMLETFKHLLHKKLCEIATKHEFNLIPKEIYQEDLDLIEMEFDFVDASPPSYDLGNSAPPSTPLFENQPLHLMQGLLFRSLIASLWSNEMGCRRIAENILTSLLNSSRSDQLVNNSELNALLNENSALKIVNGKQKNISKTAMRLLTDGPLQDFQKGISEPAWLIPVLFCLSAQEVETKTDTHEDSLTASMIKKWGQERFDMTKQMYHI